MKKKLTSILLASVLAVSLSAPVLAESTTSNRTIPEEYSLSAIDLDIVTSDLTWLVVNPSQYSKIEIGNYIPAYVWNGSELISSEEEVLFFPIYGDNKIVSILTMIDPNGDKGYTVGVDFASELNNALKNGVKEFFLVEAGSKIFLCTDGNTLLLKDYGEPEEVILDGLDSHDDEPATEKSNESAPIPDSPNFSQKTSIAEDYDASNSLTANGLESYIVNENNQYLFYNETDYSLFNTDTNRLDITPQSYHQSRDIVYLPLQKLYQGNTQTCTFYASTVIGNYLTDQSISPNTVMNWAGKTFGNISDAQKVLNDYYKLSYSYIYDIYGRDANKFIDRGWPLYSAFYDDELDVGHAMAVCGYDDSGNAGIYVMDSAIGNYRAIYPSGPSKYVTRAYSKDCTWRATLYYHYW